MSYNKSEVIAGLKRLVKSKYASQRWRKVKKAVKRGDLHAFEGEWAPLNEVVRVGILGGDKALDHMWGLVSKKRPTKNDYQRELMRQRREIERLVVKLYEMRMGYWFDESERARAFAHYRQHAKARKAQFIAESNLSRSEAIKLFWQTEPSRIGMVMAAQDKANAEERMQLH